MKKLLPLLLLIPLLGCPKDKNARDVAASLKGLLGTAQTQYQDTCSKDPSQAVCTTINRGIAAQNALITATEMYCGWATSGPPPDPNAVCVPVSSFQQTLQSAVANANQAITEIKGIIKP